MVIKILGTGCAKCKLTQEVIEKVSKELNLTPTIEKVEDIQEIMKYNVLYVRLERSLFQRSGESKRKSSNG